MVGALLLAAAAVVVTAVAAAAALGRLPRNSVAGIRIPSLLASEPAWVAGHRAAVPTTGVAAVVCVGLAIAVTLDSALVDVLLPVQTAVLVAGVLVGAVLARRAALAVGGLR